MFRLHDALAGKPALSFQVEKYLVKIKNKYIKTAPIFVVIVS